MKLKLTILALALSSMQVYSQAKNNISLVYGITSNTIYMGRVMSDGGYDTGSGIIYGLNYSRNINNYLSVETGLHYSNDKVSGSSFSGATYHFNGEIKMISIPVIAKFSFFKYFYADAGFNTDFQTNYTSNSIGTKQSGIGLEGGLGAAYSFGKIKLFINPYFQEHNIISYAGKNSNNLVDAGYKFGAGYNF
ncbi:outer membrane beta-barrel protein [Mucilaginibacter sp.]|uniref:outer membrane beta-barrel protein n=1 Tax=Mucilaginibacter sp. TaxID=1882438 RepID=UPI00261E3261|nr:outer membrane beta-barrel protein [Mucilaginibacter sp.]